MNNNASTTPYVVPVEIIRDLREHFSEWKEIDNEYYCDEDEDKEARKRKKAVKQLNDLRQKLAGKGLDRQQQEEVIAMLRAHINAFHDEDNVAVTTSPGCWVASAVVSLLLLLVIIYYFGDVFSNDHYNYLNKYTRHGFIWICIFPAAMLFYSISNYFKSRTETSKIKVNQYELADKEQAKSISDYALLLKRTHGYSDEDLEIALPQYGLSFRDTNIIIKNLKP